MIFERSKTMVEENIRIEGARIGFRNFSGEEGRFNPKGRRNFCVFLEEDIAKDMENEGWNIKWLQPREEGDEPQAYIQVKVVFGKIPPKIVVVTSRGKSRLDADTVNILDWAEIENVDLVIRPYNWEVNGNAGVSAYLKTMYVTLREDEFESKYYDVPDSAASAIME